jgi:hypothetical protein
MLVRLLCAALVCAAAAAAAAAQEVKVGATSVTLAAPAGFCPLTESHPVDARVIAAAREGLRPGHLLGQYADCRQLADWRTGKRGTLDDVLHYAARPTMMQVDGKGSEAEVKGLCGYMRAEGAKTFPAAELKTRVEATAKGVQVNETRFTGVVAEEPTVCYWAMLQKLKTDAGADKTNVSVSAVILVKGKLISGVMTSPYVNADSVAGVLARQKSNVAALLAANRS